MPPQPTAPLEHTSILSGLIASDPELRELLKKQLNLQIAREEIQLRRTNEDEVKIKAAADQARAAQLQGAQEAKKIMARDEQWQANCPHRRSDGASNLGGLKNWDGSVNVSCGTCNMVDVGTMLEMKKKYGPLFPPDKMLGGPLPPGGDYD